MTAALEALKALLQSSIKSMGIIIPVFIFNTKEDQWISRLANFDPKSPERESRASNVQSLN